jgi:hypothetical protein
VDREGVRGRDEGEIGNDDLVSGLEVQEEGRQFQSVRARRRQQRLRDAELALQELLTSAGEGSIAGYLSTFDRSLDVLPLASGERRSVERDP